MPEPTPNGEEGRPDVEFEMACGATHALPDYGVTLGYVVLTLQPDDSLQPDWDGLLHPTFEEGQRAIRQASDGSCCVLVEAKRVPVNPPLPASTAEGAGE